MTLERLPKYRFTLFPCSMIPSSEGMPSLSVMLKKSSRAFNESERSEGSL